MTTPRPFDDLIDPPASDAELIALLRGGDTDAYETLWSRHVAAALTLARRIAPEDAEDLVSDAFMAVYDQIRVRGNGPEAHFRAYLFTIIRNLAARTFTARSQVILDPEADTISDVDGLSVIEEDDEAALLLQSFRALPARWQRVLWLSEVENAKRSEIAKELRIGLNAVSALHRRARAGLRTQWLLARTPADLRDDPAHVASQLPSVLVGTASEEERERISAHLEGCERCAWLEADLRAAYSSSQSRTLAMVGFGALAVTLPTASTLWGGAAGAAAIVAAIAAITVGSVALVSGQLGEPQSHHPAPITSPAPMDQDERGTDQERPLPAPETLSSDAADGATAPPPDAADPEVIDFWVPNSPIPEEPPRPPAPLPAPPGSVPPASEHPDDGSDTDPPPAFFGAPAAALEQPSTGYLGPVLSGSADEDVTVAIDLAGNTYTVVPDDTGSWSFDARPLPLPVGEHTATVWIFRDEQASAPLAMPFTIEELALAGIPHDVLMDLTEASTDGIVFTLGGPASGAVCVSNDSGQAAAVALDDDGAATRRLRFLTAGLYVMSFAVCDGGYTGPGINHALWVSSGFFDPWGEEPVFEIEEIDPIGP